MHDHILLCEPLGMTNIERKILAVCLLAGLSAAAGFGLMWFHIFDGAKLITQISVIVGVVGVVIFRILRLKGDDAKS